MREAEKNSVLYGDNRFSDHYTAAYIRLEPSDRIRYCGMMENAEFDVDFQYVNGEFILKSFGMKKNIPADWDK